VTRLPWPEFGFLILTAVALYYLKWPLLVPAAIVLLFRGLFFLTERYPRTIFLRGPLGGGRR
jgi:hypothetical protein